MFTPKMLAYPCRPAITQRVEALPLVSRQAHCSVLPAPAVCNCLLIRCYLLDNGVASVRVRARVTVRDRVRI